MFILLALIFGGAVAYYAEPYVRNNPEAIGALLTIFTVFAGFLVAIVTILGDPSLIPSGSWRSAENNRDEIEARIIRNVWLFTSYLVAIGLLFVAIVLSKIPTELVGESVRIWIARAYIFFGAFSFLLTFALPHSLLRLQRARVDAEIERRRVEANLKGNETYDTKSD